MVNNVIRVVNYVIAARPSLLNFMIADRPMPVQRLESAVLPAAPPGGRCRFEYTYGGLSGRRCCTLLLYRLFDLFEFRF
jgi:hypothetical protein